MVDDQAEVREWLAISAQDLDQARFLLLHKRPAGDTAFHIQQGIEKALKAYLLGQGWKLQKIHDVVKLTHEAIQRDPSFQSYQPFMETIAGYYVETRYPPGTTEDIAEDELKSALTQAQALHAAIVGKLGLGERENHGRP